MADLAVGEAGIDGAEKVLNNGIEYSKDRHARVYKEMIEGNPYVNPAKEELNTRWTKISRTVTEKVFEADTVGKGLKCFLTHHMEANIIPKGYKDAQYSDALCGSQPMNCLHAIEQT